MDPQAQGYTVVAFHPESKGIVIYFVPKDDSGKGTILNIGEFAKCNTAVTPDRQGCHHLSSTPFTPWSTVISDGSRIPEHHARA